LKRRLLLAAPLLAVIPALLSGCTLANAINPPIDSAIYATVPDAKGADPTVALPDWVPADAAMIRMTVDTVDLEKIMTFTVPQPPLPEGADPATTPPPPVAPIGTECPAAIAAHRPTLDDSWWIPTIAPDAVITCSGDWHIIIAGLRVYAWTP
jgi:hypothetical protein